MIHPHTEIRIINPKVGYGVFATQFIPEGTITYIKDDLEIEIGPEEYTTHTEIMQEVIEKYSYIDQRGVRIISWDLGKYVNHCCNCNTISTGYGFEIAIRDIHPGEQITDEYGIFNLTSDMSLECGYGNCRKTLRPSDFETYYKKWDESIKSSLKKLPKVEQPLIGFMDKESKVLLDKFQKNESHYLSVYALKYHGVQNGKHSDKEAKIKA